MKKISVVMATYNGEKFIDKQLNSIINQSLKPTEIIIIDDFSEDRTKEILEKYKNLNSTIKIVYNNNNEGHFNTFLKGIFMSEGDYIFLSDQDDIWKLEKIEKMVKILEKNEEIVLLRSNSVLINDEDTLITKLRNKKRLKEINRKKNWSFWGSGYEMAFVSSIRDFLKKIDISLLKEFEYHDVMLGMLSPILGKTFFLEEELNFHRLHNKNVTRRITTKSLKANKIKKIELLEKHKKRYKNLLKIAKNNEIKNKKNIESDINDMLHFTCLRENLVKNINILTFFSLLFSLKNYYRKKDFLSDIVYSFKR